ncbi:glycoside hydrolase [Epithele typhae]|uniref:glycoside hydrolase n=1 Tax=Epithele typhae TaxID=378194 RepID=UPI00200780D8|nr:glycoside hydrolase [Epithele typhae]KAH9940761.1 glycoside hydrolase [Epithele typhae]
MKATVIASVVLASLARHAAAAAAIPDQIYGVNIGSWLVLEAWMLPNEWTAMGGNTSCSCSDAGCIGDEFNFAKAYPDTVDAIMNTHWDTWFNQSHVDTLVKYGLNAVRVPLGYWIVERLVDRTTEYYPKGGILQLQRGLKQLKDAGIVAILDHHALPGVQTANQQFTGRCTSDVQFYTDYNYQRALTWTAVMTAISHLDPAFGSVAGIEAMNEPIMDSSKTPGYGTFQQNYVQTIRAMEAMMGIGPSFLDISVDVSQSSPNVTAALSAGVSKSTQLSDMTRKALLDSIPILVELSTQLEFSLLGSALSAHGKEPLVASFMDATWQWGNRSNPADAASGPMGYDNHLYYAWGGVADPNEEAYMTSSCNLPRVADDLALNNTPLWFGEWGLPTQFSATDAFLTKWADAQKFAYSKGRGWFFWNFRTEKNGDLGRQWSYFEGVERGFFTEDPKAYNDPNVCVPYIAGPSSSSAAASATSASASSSASATSSSVESSTSTGEASSVASTVASTTAASSAASTASTSSASTTSA